MSNHISEPADLHPTDQLAPLLSGDLTLAELRSVVTHVRRCPHCQAELVEVSAGYGALQAVAREGLDDLAEPPPLAVHPIEVAPVLSVAPTDGEGGAGGQGNDRGTGSSGPSGGRARALTAFAAAAAAVVLLVGGVLIGTRLETDGRVAAPATTTTAPPASASVALEPVGPTDAAGTVAMADIDGTDGTEQLMTVETSQLPPAPDGHFYEVWLLQPETNQMLAVGVLPNDAASFTLPAALVANYQAVDVSLQADDGGVVHSGNSILRATYA